MNTSAARVTEVSLHLGNALEKYEDWPRPTTIISDGPYGLSKFPGDPNGVDGLGECYAPQDRKSVV